MSGPACPFGTIALGPIPADLSALHPDERAHGEALPAARRDEWLAGRATLRAALAAAGLVVDDAILPAPGGGPRLPVTVRGSLSHKRDRAAALAAPADGPWWLGIDLEARTPGRIDISRMVLTDEEREDPAARSDPALGAALLMLRFAAKEALYKAMHPFLQRHVGFHEAAAWPTPDGRIRYPLLPAGVVAEAWYAVVGGQHVVAARARPA